MERLEDVPNLKIYTFGFGKSHDVGFLTAFARKGGGQSLHG